MLITVFTPTFNRAYIIESLYHSLRHQNFMDFEWIVVDDGSVDNTHILLNQWTSASNPFAITYLSVRNGGKHRAINKGVQIARGELFFIVDSDDRLTDHSLERVAKVAASIPEVDKDSFAGVCGDRGSMLNSPIGGGWKAAEYLDITVLQRDQYGITGDKAEVFFTSVLRQYPFPEFEGENFISESIVWDRIAFDGYKMRFFNEVIYLCEYLPDGLTNNIANHVKSSPRGYGKYISQSVSYGKISGFDKWRWYLGYYYKLRDQMSVGQIAAYLNENKSILYAGLAIMRIAGRIGNSKN